MAFWKSKVKVSPEQMGQVLCSVAINRTQDFLRNKELLNEIGLGSIEPFDIFIEMVTLNMFGIIEVFQNSRMANDEQSFKTLDYMHMLFFKELTERFNFSSNDISELHSFMSDRYSEYKSIMEANKNGNWLEAVGARLYRNIHAEDIQDAIGIFHLATEIASIFKFTPNLLKEYKIL